MSFANQFMAALYIRKNHAEMERKVIGVPVEIDREVARSALDSLGISIGEATKEQLDYAKSWSG
jgi:adenosylhomocysteinase